MGTTIVDQRQSKTQLIRTFKFEYEPKNAHCQKMRETTSCAVPYTQDSIATNKKQLRQYIIAGKRKPDKIIPQIERKLETAHQGKQLGCQN